MAPRYVLIVDDDEATQDFLRMALAEEGYSVVIAGDGYAALAAIAKSPPAVILLDLMMPRMDGYTFLLTYGQYPAPHAPIIGMTARWTSKNPFLELNVDDYLLKPFDLDDLLRAVARFVYQT